MNFNLTASKPEKHTRIRLHWNQRKGGGKSNTLNNDFYGPFLNDFGGGILNYYLQKKRERHSVLHRYIRIYNAVPFLGTDNLSDSAFSI